MLGPRKSQGEPLLTHVLACAQPSRQPSKLRCLQLCALTSTLQTRELVVKPYPPALCPYTVLLLSFAISMSFKPVHIWHSQLSIIFSPTSVTLARTCRRISIPFSRPHPLQASTYTSHVLARQGHEAVRPTHLMEQLNQCFFNATGKLICVVFLASMARALEKDTFASNRYISLWLRTAGLVLVASSVFLAGQCS